VLTNGTVAAATASRRLPYVYSHDRWCLSDVGFVSVLICSVLVFVVVVLLFALWNASVGRLV